MLLEDVPCDPGMQGPVAAELDRVLLGGEDLRIFLWGGGGEKETEERERE